MVEYASVEVLSPIKKGEGAFSAHVAYDIVAVDASGMSTTNSRRYSDFVWLFERLCESYPECLIPPLPPKGCHFLSSAHFLHGVLFVFACARLYVLHVSDMRYSGMIGRFEEGFINERMRFLQTFTTRCINVGHKR